MQPKNYSIEEVFNNTSIGLKFEFYSSKQTQFIAEDLAKSSGKNVIISNDYKMLPSWSSAILLKEYNGKRPRYQLKLSSQDFMSVGSPLHSILEWIKNEAVLDYSTKLEVSLMFKNAHLQTLSTISNMDIGKMVLKIDENFLFSKFPEMKVSPFSLSIKKIIPFDGFINTSSSLSNINTFFKMPVSEHYAVDFTEQTQGIIKFNYIGGPNYSKKGQEINEAIKYYILTTYQVLNTTNYTSEMKYDMDKMFENYSKIRRAYYEPEFFLNEYKDIKVSVDLNRHSQIIKTYWSQLRDPLLRIVLESNLTKGFFNWDSNEGKYELKDAKISGSRIKGIHLINCEVTGLIEGCYLWRSKIKNSKIIESILVTGNKVESSLLNSCRADLSNKILKSYILNRGEIINCDVKESIIINAGIGSNAKLDEECTLIEPVDKTPIVSNKKLEIEEIRDYKWIKDMRKSEDKGFANEFKMKY